MRDSILKSCGRGVDELWKTCGQVIELSHTQQIIMNAWGKGTDIFNTLYQFCAQVTHIHSFEFSSVNQHFYPLSTRPIRTTKWKRKD